MKRLVFKRLVFVVACCLPLLCRAQFVLQASGFEPIVLNFDNTDAATLYQKTLEFVNQTYRNPDEVPVGTVENKSVKIRAIAPELLIVPAVGRYYYDAHHTVLFEFKDGKVRVTPQLQRFTRPGSYDVSLSDLFKKDGTRRSRYEESFGRIEKYFNALIESYRQSITQAGNDDR